MRKFSKLILLCGAGAAVTGCQTIDKLEAQSRVDPRSIAYYPRAGLMASASQDGCTVAPQLPGDFGRGAINLDCLAEAKIVGRDATGQPIVKNYPLYVTAIESAVARNRLASILLKHSDDVCTAEMGNLIAREAMVNTGLSVATSAFSTLSALVTGEFAKTALASGSSFTNATRDHVNSEVYRNVVGTAVARAITNERKDLRGAMIQRFDQEPSVYTVDQMIMEANQYHQTCSFMRGLELVVEAVERQGMRGAAERRTLDIGINELDREILRDQRLVKDASLPQATRDKYAEKLAELIDKRSEKVIERAGISSSNESPIPPEPPKPAPTNPPVESPPVDNPPVDGG